MEKNLAAEGSGHCRPPGPRAAPWLVVSHGKGNDDQNDHQVFYNISYPNTTYHKSIPEMNRKFFTYWQSPSHEGWLIIVCNVNDDQYSNSKSMKLGDCFLWNPVSLKKIQLPTLLHWIQSHEYDIRNCVLSSPPSNPDSMVFFLFRRHPDLLLVCHPGDKKWRTHEFYTTQNESTPISLLWFKGKLYVTCSSHWHLEVKKLGLHDNETLSIRSFRFNEKNQSPLVGALKDVRSSYVESFGELFRVDKIEHPSVDDDVVNLHVFRMNFSLMAWEEAKSLGNNVLFLGQNTTASCSAAELGLIRGCVYFAQPEDDDKMSLYTFDIEDGSISVSLPCADLSTSSLFSPDWVIMPPVSRILDGGRRTEDVLGNNGEESIIIKAEENKASAINDIEKEEVQKNNGEVLVAGIWGILNGHILELIASYLHPVDYMSFRAVCKENRAAIPAISWRNSSSKLTQTTSLSPIWLVYSKRNDVIYNFVDPMRNNEKYLMNLSELLFDATIYSSKGGWLLMSEGKKAPFFFNPFTRAMVQLPDLPQRDCNYLFSSMSFSSLPTSSDCVVCAITKWVDDEVQLFFIKRGDDFWSDGIYENTELPSMEKCIEFTSCLTNPVFYNKSFYCLDYKGTLGVYGVDDDSWNVLAKPRQLYNSIYRNFLVECEGRLLSVFLGHMGQWVQIFSLDFSNMVWVEVKSLGKHMLFISHSSCLSAIAPNSRMENKIFFNRFHGERIIFYSLDTGTHHSIGSQHSSKDFYNTTEMLNCGWIEPNWSQTTDQELDWLSV